MYLKMGVYRPICMYTVYLKMVVYRPICIYTGCIQKWVYIGLYVGIQGVPEMFGQISRESSSR